jgi:hypothetical protein
MHLFFSLFIVLGILAFIYLLVGALGLNELLPRHVSSRLIKLSVTIIVTAIPLGLYDLSGAPLFLKAAAVVFVIGLLLTARREKRPAAKAGEGEWACGSCGEVNLDINKECVNCGRTK